MPTILVEVRNVYGKDLIYPANHNASLLAKLVGKKTLTAHELEIAKQLGHEVNVRPSYQAVA